MLSTCSCEVGDQRRQFRPEMAPHVLRRFRLRGLSAVRADGFLTSVFGNVRLDRRQLGHLMPPRLSLCGYLSATAGEAAITMAAAVRQQVDSPIDPLCRDQAAPVARVAVLTTRFAAALAFSCPPEALLTGQPIGRRRLR